MLCLASRVGHGMEPKQRGGYRAKAGRPRKPDEERVRDFKAWKLRPAADLLAALEAQMRPDESRQALLNRLLRERLGLEG